MNEPKKSFTERMRDPLFIKRIIMTTVSILLGAVPVGVFKASGLGVDPFQVFCAGMNNVIPISFGTLYTCINIVLLIAMFFADRHYIGLGTIINLLLLGYVIDFVQHLVEGIFPDPTMLTRVLMILCAIPVLCITSALYFTADMGVSTYDIWALWLDKKTPAPFRLIRIGTDCLCVALGFALLGFKTGGVLGIGTILTAFFMGPLIDFFNRTLARPLLYGREKAREMNEEERRRKATAKAK